MAGYTELIKNFKKIRSFTRDFFIYGFKGRSDFAELSPRSYDNERRRIESYLGELILKKSDLKGKTISISSNTTAKTSNPLFKIWQTKSFTKRDCFLHFLILDSLKEHKCLNVGEIAEIISISYASQLIVNEPVDTMTIRNKLNEYTRLGILEAEKSGKTLYYSLSRNPFEEMDPKTREALDIALSYYKNILPAGFIGHSIHNVQDSPFIYKQIFFSQILDDEILLQVLKAIGNKQVITLTMISTKGNWSRKTTLIPLKVLSNTKTGRRYVAIYNIRTQKFSNVRLDYIKDAAFGDPYPDYDSISTEYEHRMKNSFSITHQPRERLHTVKMLLHIDEDTEQYVLERIRREGRGGVVTRVDKNTFEYSLDVADILEMVPWLRTFIGRIIKIEGSENHVILQFKRDISTMMSRYGEVFNHGQHL